MTLALIALIVGFAGGVIGTGALAHNWPLLFIDPEKFFLKLQRKVEKKLDYLEEESKKKVKKALNDMARTVSYINLIK